MKDEHQIQFELFSSSFCTACRATRRILQRATELIPNTEFIEHDIAHEPGLAEIQKITATPTVIVRDASGVEVFRSAGVPKLSQVIQAAALARESG